MTEEDDFLANVVADPDADEPRLAYATWLEQRADPRGEFIRLQCERARLPADSPSYRHLLEREQQLLQSHGRPGGVT